MAEIINRGAGKYLVRIFLGRDATGRTKYLNKTITGNKKDALAWARDQETARDMGGVMRPAKVSLGQFLDDWLAHVVKSSVRSRTHADYEQMLARYVRPVLGAALLSEIQHGDVQDVYNRMSARGLSARTVQFTHSILSSAFRYAVERRLLALNPAFYTKRPPKAPTRKIEVMDEAQASGFMAAAKSDSLYPLFAFALSTGPRPEEYIALQWPDVDLERGTARIHQVVIEEEKDKRWYFAPVKTENSKRILSIPPSTLQVLKDHRQRLLRDKLKRRAERMYDEHDFVFPSRRGGPLSQRNIYNRHMLPILEAVGLPRSITLYCLRHTFATLALARGVDVKTVSSVLGHASSAFTMDTYCKVLPSMKAAQVAAIEDVLFGVTSH
jgi:integrase